MSGTPAAGRRRKEAAGPGARRRNSTFLEELGPGGLSTLLLAFATGVAGLGLPVAWQARKILRLASGEPLRRSDALLILGRELRDDALSPVYRARLEHGASLWRDGWAPRVIVSGGMTGTASRSEASAGRDLLIDRGLPAEAIWTEDRSRHTLENLFFVREALGREGLRTLILVSDPLHIGRARALARGLALDVVCSPALAAPPRPGTLTWWLRAGREGFLLHWYRVGVVYSRVIGSERMLSRVT